MSHTPDDYMNYIITCPMGHKYHASERGCGECDILIEHAAMEPCECGHKFSESDWRIEDGHLYANCPGCFTTVWR